MKSSRSFAVTLLPALATAAAMHMAVVLFAFRDNPIADHGGMLLWWGFLVLYDIIIGAYLRRPRELRSIVLLSGAVCLCQLGVTIWLRPIYSGVIWWLAAVCMWVAGYYRCAMAHLEGVKPETLMSTFEVIMLLLFVAAVMVSGGAMASGVIWHLAVGLLCVLIAMMRLRTMHTRLDASRERPMVRLLLPLLLVVTAGCAVLVSVLITGHAATVLSRITAWLAQVGRMLAKGIGVFFLWLFSLLPSVDGDLGEEVMEGAALPSGTVEGVSESSNALLYFLIAFFVIAFLVVLMKVWRKVRFRGRRQVQRSTKTVVVKKRSFLDVLLHFVRRCAARVRFELRYLRGRNTPQGLLVWLDRRMRRKRKGRGTGESVAAFLRRVGDSLPAEQAHLQELSRCLDCCYFGDGAAMSSETVREMRRSIRRELSNL